MLGFEPQALCMLSTCSTTELSYTVNPKEMLFKNIKTIAQLAGCSGAHL